jgi:hypothetical protein
MDDLGQARLVTVRNHGRHPGKGRHLRRRHVGIAAGRHDERLVATAGRTAQDGARLDVGMVGDGAGVHQADVGGLAEGDNPVAEADQILRRGARLGLVDFAPQAVKARPGLAQGGGHGGRQRSISQLIGD